MRRITALRVSILASIGLLPLACGDDDEGPGGGALGGEGGGALVPVGGEGGSDVIPVGGEGGVTTTAGAGGAGGAGGFTGGKPPKCTAPTTDPESGLVRCQEGYSHRPQAVAWGAPNAGGAGGAEATQGGTGSELPRANREDCSAGGAGGGGGAGAGDCSQFELGFCRVDTNGPTAVYCESGCVTDSDCGSGQICECGHPESPSGGVCVRGSCSSNDDCAEGFRCASSTDLCGYTEFACQTAEDECSVNSDCDAGVCMAVETDASSPNLVRICEGGACGRPFLVQADARVAPTSARRDWLAADFALPDAAQLPTDEREHEAARWTRLAQLEHASVAAFARFSLQLLSLGAPADLVEACTRALADETAHARLCFSLASAYAGRPIGPAPLDIAGSLSECSLLEVVDLVLIEGCVGETSAALEALALGDAASEPSLRQAYALIARDERTHAELAFRFVRWALAQDPAGVRQRIARLLTALPSTDAVRGVVRPCLNALLDLERGGSLCKEGRGAAAPLL